MFRSCQPEQHLLVFDATLELIELVTCKGGAAQQQVPAVMTLLAPTPQALFTSYLGDQRAARTKTICRPPRHVAAATHLFARQPEVEPDEVRFRGLEHGNDHRSPEPSQEDRDNGPTTRNARQAGIHALFR